MIKLLCSVLCLVAAAAVASDTVPEQIHIALTGSPREMVVAWVTTGDTSASDVQYDIIPRGGDKGAYKFATTGPKPERYHFPYPLPLYTSGQMHFATLTELYPATKYYYRVGSDEGGWSAEMSFVTEDEGKFPLNIAVVGDIGVSDNSRMVMGSMERFDAKQPFDFLIHPGDLSYANGNQTIWDVWGRMIEPFASHVPYMVAPGNHEIIDLFIPYLKRFAMPAKQSKAAMGNLYYSFDYSIVHVIALSSETFEYFHISDQYKWLQSDLESIDREKTPWVLAFFHSPWYNSNKKHPNDGKSMRDSYEDLFMQYGVDLVLTGHVHAYERTHAVYKDQLNPSAPEYRTVGNGGNREGLYHSWVDPSPEWSAAHASVFGYGTFEVHNATHGYWQMIKAEDDSVADDCWVVRNRDSKREGDGEL